MLKLDITEVSTLFKLLAGQYSGMDAEQREVFNKIRYAICQGIKNDVQGEDVSQSCEE